MAQADWWWRWIQWGRPRLYWFYPSRLGRHRCRRVCWRLCGSLLLSLLSSLRGGINR
jgi:hypothetical protein